jgi:hypothetical protein
MMNALLLLVVGQFTIPSDDFSQKVVAEYPDLATVQTDWERVNILRRWAWSHTDYVHHANVADDNSQWSLGKDADPKQWKRQTAPEYFARFERGEGGVLCGGASFGLRLLYEHFGFRAWNFCNGDKTSGYDGNDSRPGHCQTIVQINHLGNTLIVLQDCSFNQCFVDATSGEPIDYFELRRRLVNRDLWSIHVVETDYLSMKGRYPRMYFPAAELKGRTADEIQRLYYPVLDTNYSVETLLDGSLRFTSPRTWAKFLRVRAHDIDTGAPTDFVQWWADNGYGIDHGAQTMLYAHLWTETLHCRDGIDVDLARRVSESDNAELARLWQAKQK